MDRLFLDANVLFSAAYHENAGLIVLWSLEDVELITSEYAAEEARTNLFESAQRHRLDILLRTVRTISGVAALPVKVTLPPKDLPILQAAVFADATHLLTGDKQHFGHYLGRKIGNVLVLLPGQYLKRRRSRPD